jgi:hypothetical protein
MSVDTRGSGESAGWDVRLRVVRRAPRVVVSGYADGSLGAPHRRSQTRLLGKRELELWGA